jgi:hypothetical protein
MIAIHIFIRLSVSLRNILRAKRFDEFYSCSNSTIYLPHGGDFEYGYSCSGSVKPQNGTRKIELTVKLLMLLQEILDKIAVSKTAWVKS